MRNYLLALLLGCLFFGFETAGAQWQPDGANAKLKLQGRTASSVDPTMHDLSCYLGGPLRLRVESGSNPLMPLILAASTVDPTGVSVRNVPGLGIINIGLSALPLPAAIILLGDGISHTVNPVLDNLFVTGPFTTTVPFFEWTAQVSSALLNYKPGFQAVVADPSAFPFGMALTEAASAEFRVGFEAVTGPQAISGQEFYLPPGMQMPFHGIYYSSFFVHDAGFVTFGGPTTVPNAGFSLDARSFVAAEPAIAAWISDWDPRAFSPNDGIWVQMDGNSVQVRWGDPRGHPSGALGIAHTGDLDANRFSLEMIVDPGAASVTGPLNPNFGEFRIDIDQVAGNTQVRRNDGIVGQTPGGAALTMLPRDLDLHAPSVGFAGSAMIEEHAATWLNETLLGFDGAGSGRLVHSLESWQGQSIHFQPGSIAIPGDLGYSSFSSGVAPPLVSGVYPLCWDRNGGGIATIAGKFQGFSSQTTSGTVFVVDGAGTMIPVTVQGVLDNSGVSVGSIPFALPSVLRNAEGLRVTMPNLQNTMGPWNLQVQYASGFSATLPLQTHNGVIITDYFPGDETVVRHRTQLMPISLYGVSYTDVFISTNGLLCFGRGAPGVVSSNLRFRQGPAQSGLPAVAVFWTDLAPPANGPPGRIRVSENPGLGTIEFSWQGFEYFAFLSNTGPFAIVYRPQPSWQFLLNMVQPTNPIQFPENVTMGITASDGLLATGFYVGITSPVNHETRGGSISSILVTSFLATLNQGNWTMLDVSGFGMWSIF